jgi:hypothetical protein
MHFALISGIAESKISMEMDWQKWIGPVTLATSFS